MDDDDNDSRISVGKDDEPTCSSTDSTTPQDSEEMNSSSNHASDNYNMSNRNPTCSLCRNHGVIKKLKGHKRYCPWRTCPCDLCRVTNKKRRINAAQVALRRAQAADEERASSGEANQEDSAPSLPSEPPPPAKEEPPKQSLSVTKLAEPAKKSSSQVTCSPLRPPGMGCQPGPIAFGQQISLTSVLLSQTASFLIESLRDPQVKLRLTPEIVPFLDQNIRDARLATEEVVLKLAEAQKQLEHLKSQYSFPIFGDQNRGIALTATSIPYYGTAPHPPAYRNTVITGPTEFPGSFFHPYGTLHPLPTRRVP